MLSLHSDDNWMDDIDTGSLDKVRARGYARNYARLGIPRSVRDFRSWRRSAVTRTRTPTRAAAPSISEKERPGRGRKHQSSHVMPPT